MMVRNTALSNAAVTAGVYIMGTKGSLDTTPRAFFASNGLPIHLNPTYPSQQDQQRRCIPHNMPMGAKLPHRCDHPHLSDSPDIPQLKALTTIIHL